MWISGLSFPTPMGRGKAGKSSRNILRIKPGLFLIWFDLDCCISGDAYRDAKTFQQLSCYVCVYMCQIIYILLKIRMYWKYPTWLARGEIYCVSCIEYYAVRKIPRKSSVSYCKKTSEKHRNYKVVLGQLRAIEQCFCQLWATLGLHRLGNNLHLCKSILDVSKTANPPPSTFLKKRSVFKCHVASVVVWKKNGPERE